MLKEIVVKDNTFNLKVFINDVPDISQMPNEDLSLFVECIYCQMLEHLKKKDKRKQKSTKSVKI